MQPPPLVGRGPELDTIQQALRSRERGIVLVGEPGVGKTRLATEARHAAEHDGWSVRWATASHATAAVPFGAVAHLLGPPVPNRPLDTGPAVFEVLNRAARDLRPGDPESLALFVDDADLVDPLTAALLVQLASQRHTFVFVTARSGDAAPEPLRALWSGDVAERIDLGPLPIDDVAAMAEARLRGPLDGRSRRLLYDVTRGNPLFVREMITDGLESGALADRGGIWVWRGPVGNRPQLRELIHARLGGLSRAQRDALEVLAVGGPLEIDAAAKVIDPVVAEELERAGLVSVRTNGRTLLGMVDPLYAEVVRSSVPVLARRRIERTVAEVLEASGPSGGADLLRVARMRLQSGGGSVSLLTDGAKVANAVHDRRLAEQLARAALNQEDLVEAWLALGEALGSEGRSIAAEGVLRPLLGRPMTDLQRMQLALHLLVATFWGRGQVGDSEVILREIDSSLDDPGTWHAVIEAVRAEMLTVAGRTAEAVEIVRRLYGDPTTVPVAKSRASMAISALTMAGNANEALALIPAMADAAAASEELLPHASTWVLAARLLALYASGRCEEMDSIVDAVYGMAVVTGTDENRAAISVLKGHRALTQGRPRTAARWIREATAVFEEQDPNRYGSHAFALLGWAHAMVGDVKDAAEALARSQELEAPWIAFSRPDRLVAAAWVAWAKGERTRAVGLAVESAHVAASQGQGVFEAFSWHEAYRLGFAAEPALVDRLQELAAAVDGPRVDAYAGHVAAAKADSAAGLEEAAAALAASGHQLAAAEAWREAAGAHRRAHHDASSVRCLRASAALLDQCEGARTPLLEQPVGEVPALTRREQEIVGLAARGLSNAEIAQALVLSVRTVEGHLYNAFGKLGITDRQELGSLR